MIMVFSIKVLLSKPPKLSRKSQFLSMDPSSDPTLTMIF